MADLITFVTEEGQVIRGSVMGAFEDDLSGKNYVIYTDNSVNETGNYNIFEHLMILSRKKNRS